MRYEIFADRVFLLHLCMNFLLLVLTAQLGGYRVGWRRLGAVSALGSLLFLGVLLVPVGGSWGARLGKTAVLAAGTGVGLYIAFCVPKERTGPVTLSEYAKAAVRETAEAAVWYIASACVLGGAVAAAEGIRKGGPVFLPALAAAVGSTGLLGKKRLQQKSPFWEVELKEGERQCRVRALLDSGNSLYDPLGGGPVCIIERETAEQLGLFGRPENFRVIPYHSIGRQHGVLRAALVEEMHLQKGKQRLEKRNVLLAVSGQRLSGKGRYQMLLHPALLEGTKGADHDIESSDAGKDAV